jgi:rhodanese-related sulfurtransferase
MLYQTILPIEVATRIEQGEELNLIDVREPIEHEIASVKGARLLPLSRFNEWVDDLKPVDEIIVMCHHGVRSANVCLFLARNGFEKVFNLEGGIDLWSTQVDSSIPRY